MNLTTKIKNYLLAIQLEKYSDDKYIKYLVLLSNINFLFRRRDRIKAISQETSLDSANIYVIDTTKKKRIAVQSLKRSPRFLSGMEFAGERLWNQYGMSEFKFNNASPVILDIGANIGEFSIYASNKFNAQVYSFEPDPVAYKCLVANTEYFNAKSINLNIALSNETSKNYFYLATSQADSSLIEPKKYSNRIEISTKKLNDILIQMDINSIDLLKMDAEGAEPEVLEGLVGGVFKIQNFAIDVGPERHGKLTEKYVLDFFRNNGVKANYFIHKSGRHLVHAGEIVPKN
jgi:FkbM family methyltransferase